jgi:hypothetical protein
MSRNTHGRSRNSDGCGAARGPSISAHLASAETNGGPADQERSPPAHQAAQAGKYRSSSGSGPVRRPNVSAWPASAGDPSRPGNANRGGTAGRAEADGGPPNQLHSPPTRPIAQADDNVPGASTTCTARADVARTGATQAEAAQSVAEQVEETQRMRINLKVAQELVAQSQVIQDILRSFIEALVDVGKHEVNASQAALIATDHYLAIVTAIGNVQAVEPVQMDAARAVGDRAKSEVHRAKAERERVAIEAHRTSTEITLANDQAKKLREAMVGRAADIRMRASTAIGTTTIAALRAALMRVAAYEVAARAAAGRAQQAAQAAGALVQELLQILSQQSGGPLRRALGRETSWRRRDFPGGPGAA